ncbi:hypothetical protein MMC28_001933 [Mycoblastus sanguinarius]|nr:hypothetical protein [Mycoblastus sanguinarius]
MGKSEQGHEPLQDEGQRKRKKESDELHPGIREQKLPPENGTRPEKEVVDESPTSQSEPDDILQSFDQAKSLHPEWTSEDWTAWCKGKSSKDQPIERTSGLLTRHDRHLISEFEQSTQYLRAPGLDSWELPEDKQLGQRRSIEHETWEEQTARTIKKNSQGSDSRVEKEERRS